MRYSKRFQILCWTAGMLLCQLSSGSERAKMSEPDYGFDRAGGDYRRLDLRTSDPTLCEEACANDARCVAWTYVKPHTVKGPRPTCWLKSSVPEKREVSHCVTGIKIQSSEPQR
jgi:hypothetical protein